MCIFFEMYGLGRGVRIFQDGVTHWTVRTNMALHR